MSISSQPWACLGDFNEILSPEEHSAGNNFLSTPGMREFKDCINSCLLSDLPYFGNTLTWSNNRGSTQVAKKLDRILVNDNWLLLYQDSVGVFGEPGISDHSPCCIYLDSFSPKQKKPFKFFTMLNGHPDFAEVVKQCWTSLPFAGSKMFLVSKKLKELKSIIRAFSTKNFSELEKRVSESFSELQSCQHALLASPSPALAALERAAHQKWIMLAKAEESFLRHRARIQWLLEGDCNSAFFHRAINSRVAQNFIHMLLDLNDVVIDDLQGIKDHILDFYQSLLGG